MKRFLSLCLSVFVIMVFGGGGMVRAADAATAEGGTAEEESLSAWARRAFRSGNSSWIQVASTLLNSRLRRDKEKAFEVMEILDGYDGPCSLDVKAVKATLASTAAFLYDGFLDKALEFCLDLYQERSADEGVSKPILDVKVLRHALGEVERKYPSEKERIGYFLKHFPAP